MKRIFLLAFTAFLIFLLSGCFYKDNDKVRILYSGSYHNSKDFLELVNYIDNYNDYLTLGYPTDIDEKFFDKYILYSYESHIEVTGKDIYLLDDFIVGDDVLYINCRMDDKNFNNNSSLCAIIFAIEKNLYNEVHDIIVNNDGIVREQRNYNVSFDYGYICSPENVMVKEGECVPEPDLPLREGYVFGGWFYDDTEYDFNDEVYNDMTLTAKWLKEGNAVFLLYSESKTSGYIPESWIFDYATYVATEFELDIAEDFFEEYMLYFFAFRYYNTGKEIFSYVSHNITENTLMIYCDYNPETLFVSPAFSAYQIVFAIRKDLLKDITDIYLIYAVYLA